MTASKNSTRPRPSTTTPPGAPPPAVSTIFASGESSLPEEAHAFSSPVRKASTSSLATAASRLSPPSSATPRASEADDCGGNSSGNGNTNTGSRTSWFGRKGTWQRASKSAPVCQTDDVSSSSFTTEREQTCAETVEVQPERPPAGDKKPITKQNELYLKRNVSTASLSKPLRMNLPPATIAPPQETPAREPTPEPRAPEPEPEPEPAQADTAKGDGTGAAQPGTDVGQASTGSWFGWWYGQPTQPAPGPEDTKDAVEEEPMAVVEVQPVPPPEEEEPVIPQEDKAAATESARYAATAAAVTTAHSRSWFGLWGGGPVVTATEEEQITEAAPVETQALLPAITESTPMATVDVPQPSEAALNPTPSPSPGKASSSGYGWGFWPKASDTKTSAAGETTTTEGEIAVASSSSEPKPQKAAVKQTDATPTSQKTVSSVSLKEEPLPESPKPSTGATPSKKAELTSNTPAPSLHSTSEVSLVDASAAKKKLQTLLSQNHVLPAFESCYRRPEPPSILRQFTKIFRHNQLSKNHLHVAKHPLRIKKAVAIGVHGFFPMRLVRTVLGEPTGTSIRFAGHAAASIKRWAEKNGVEVEVEKIALEGEGKVADRIEMLWKLLLNWIDHVRSADFVLMAAHSQGVVVGMQLLARLIEEGYVDNARIGLIGMAGINLGPFGHLPTTILTGSARELFEFQKQESAVSKKYIQALRTVLAHNARILYVGSIDDQLVPLESSTITNISHPYIYRAVFVDGRVHAPDFLSHLVGFAMKLRNLGVSDHGLIRELSSPLAGSLYGGEGHSRIYDDGAVYDLGVRHALETTDCLGVPLKVDSFELPTNANPYFLPWSLRGMLEETIVREQLAGECGMLLEQFENWKPTSKSLKDVRFRLEGIKSKL